MSEVDSDSEPEVFASSSNEYKLDSDVKDTEDELPEIGKKVTIPLNMNDEQENGKWNM